MAQPSTYNRALNFANFQASAPTTPLPATSLDEELNRIKLVIDQIRTNLALIQRDDTAIANRSIGFDQLKTEVDIGVNPPTTWATATNYVERDTVFHEANFYICETSHVSGVFATDLAADNWTLIASFEAATSATSVAFDNSTSGLTAANVQAALDEIVSLIEEPASGVASFNTRTGAVVAVAGDYDADEITFDPAGFGNTDATDVQGALADFDTAVAGKAATAHTHAQSSITDLVTDLAAKVPTTRQVATAGLATGGGDLSASRTITVTVASEAQAEAGALNTVAMTPLRVKNALDARIHTGTSAATTDFPLGKYLVAFGGGTAARNSVVAVYLSSASSGYTLTPDGAQLAGTWHACGSIDSSNSQLVERIA